MAVDAFDRAGAQHHVSDEDVMHRLRYIAFLITKVCFPAGRLKLWLRHVPCDEYECDICNPILGTQTALW